MAFELSEIVPWGRSYAEYVTMFALSATDLTKTILGCGDGPAGFNAVFTRTGGTVISVDPLYELSKDAIANRIQETFAVVIEQTRLNQQQFVWNSITSVEELGKIRRNAMAEFLADYPDGLKDGRYQSMSLPDLAFQNQRFALGLCSHLLFLYSAQLSEHFHLTAIKELCRVCDEVRIFPLLELNGKLSRYLPLILEQLTAEGYETKLVTVTYEFQKGGNQLLRIKRT